ncbi:hypothetical protein FPZ12_001250 [Amycolatopsis acidicola]|uniref:Glycosyltransferase RgtA/B/C/D-like domain-containing protein n=1 Tax=Amycolatopsis acidicola TaxID=2596893 RepID=A0A5N0VKK6_9PSEU|nr:hypothetical protein [Amycolatopsis acidicola]KAA9166849.1 hypothetical protein FPZ12_001250 [Amycolatopsis acidicola]
MLVIAVIGWVVLALVVLSGRRSGLLPFALVFTVVQQLVFATVPDSAFLTFRYAENIAAGHGAVFNIGERVEGYSNFAWLVLITLPKAMFGTDVVTGAVVLGVVCTLGCVLLAHKFHPLATVLVAAVSGLAAYESAGTEVPLFVLLVLAVLYAVRTGHPVAAGVFSALATMTRPDGAVLGGVVLLFLCGGAAWRWWNWWAPTGFALSALVLIAPWLAWRATYYHQPLGTWPENKLPFVFLLATLLAVAVPVLIDSRRKPSPKPRPLAPVWSRVVVVVLAALSVPAALLGRADVLDFRARQAQTAELGAWLAAGLPAGSSVNTGVGVVAYGLGSRFPVTDSLEGRAWRPALATPETFGYSATQQCASYDASYTVATFRQSATGHWVTVYARDDEAQLLIRRLGTDPEFVYVPCPT